MKVKAYAKLNLTLNVLGYQNGFHNIDSVAVSVDIYDVIKLTKRNDYAVTVSGLTSVNTRDNSAYKAALGFMNAFDTLGVDIVIDKRISFGAGMGGSSADAAAVIYGMCKLFNADTFSDKVHEVCASVGSDVNFMLHGGLGRLRGKGDDVTFNSLGKPLYCALTIFDTSMSTAQVYSQFDKLEAKLHCADNDKVLEKLCEGKLEDAIGLFNNGLSNAVGSLSDYATEYLRFCGEHSLCCNMTGSGSAYYVPFDNETEARAVAELLSDNGFNTVVCRSVLIGVEEVS